LLSFEKYLFFIPAKPGAPSEAKHPDMPAFSIASGSQYIPLAGRLFPEKQEGLFFQNCESSKKIFYQR
jgi:hypothetical protein